MYRIDVASAVASKPAPSALGTQGWFRDADASSGIQGTVVPADWVNMLQAELEAVRDMEAPIAASKTVLDQCKTGIEAYVAARIAEAPFPRGYIDGLIISNAAGDTANDISVATGRCRDAGDLANYDFTGPMVKRADAAWALGTNAGGWGASGARAALMGYWVHLLGHTDGSVDFGFDAAFDASNLLPIAAAVDSGWQRYRPLGWVFTDGATAHKTFIQPPNDPDTVYFDNQEPSVPSSITSSTTPQNMVLNGAPPNCSALVTGKFATSTGAAVGLHDQQVYTPGITAAGGGQIRLWHASASSYESYGANFEVLVDGNYSVDVLGLAIDANARLYLRTRGYRWNRASGG